MKPSASGDNIMRMTIQNPLTYASDCFYVDVFILYSPDKASSVITIEGEHNENYIAYDLSDVNAANVKVLKFEIYAKNQDTEV